MFFLLILTPFFGIAGVDEMAGISAIIGIFGGLMWDLQREMPAPKKLKTIFEILLDTIAQAEHFQGRAFSTFQMFSDEKLPRI